MARKGTAMGGLLAILALLILTWKPRKLTVNSINGNGYFPSDDTQDEEQQEEDIVASVTTPLDYPTFIKKYPDVPITPLIFTRVGGGGRVRRLFT